jgi:hypothetical protein
MYFEFKNYFVTEKVCTGGIAEVLRPQITKRFGPQIENPQSVTFVEGLQIQQIIYGHKFADLRFAKLICRPPTFVHLIHEKVIFFQLGTPERWPGQRNQQTGSDV